MMKRRGIVRKSQIEQIKTATPLSKTRRERYMGLRENRNEPSLTILIVGFAGLNGVFFLRSDLNEPIAKRPEMTNRIEAGIIRGSHGQFSGRDGNMYSKMIPTPKHAKKKRGGGM